MNTRQIPHFPQKEGKFKFFKFLVVKISREKEISSAKKNKTKLSALAVIPSTISSRRISSATIAIKFMKLWTHLSNKIVANLNLIFKIGALFSLATEAISGQPNSKLSSNF